jgi:N-acetylglucosamine malate deacetylase 2
VRRLLFIGAHPDDETFFAAGTFARYAEAGVSIHVVSATRGDRGKTGDCCTAEDLPTVREQELRNAMAAVGVTEIEFLPYRDRQLAEALIAAMRQQLVRVIRSVRPQIVITFDPHGTNQHPDHIAISRFVSDALAVAADPRWLPELGTPHEIERLLWTPPTFIFELPAEMDIRSAPGFDFLIDVSAWREQKIAAFESHRTQFPGLKKLFFDDPQGQRTFPTEAFRLAWGKRPGRIPADDLFAE